jgi:16S rRNA G966 N2-methylase RsmD
LQNLIPPVTYQGAKVRIAADIVDKINTNNTRWFCDVCCGSGAISLELIGRGYKPQNIYMIDEGPWGKFWEDIGDGIFSIDKLEYYCKQIPKNLDLIKDFMLELSKQSASTDTSQVFLLLQASSFGGKAIWIEDDKWRNCSFRSFWKPTAYSKRRSTVNPMMPMPTTLLKRVELILSNMRGVKGFYDNCLNVKLPESSVVYIDPPYNNRTNYGPKLNVLRYINSLKQTCYCSEGRPLNNDNEAWLISKGRNKGGISGNRIVNSNQEWLTKFH